MRLAVFRAEADGRRSAARLADHGHEAVLAPVVRIVPIGAPLVVGGADAVVFTSQHAAGMLRTDATAQALRALPCFCVGQRTAEAARAAGFESIHTGGGDARALAATIVETCAPHARIAFVAGRDRKPGLESALARRGFAVSVIEAYEAVRIAAWPPETVAALVRCGGALHFSARTAGLALGHLDAAGLSQSLTTWTHFCLSADVAGPLRAAGLSRVRVAPSPQEAALLALIDQPEQADPTGLMTP